MRLVSILLLSIMLFGCGTEGVDMEIDGVDNWFRKNETEITSIVELFKNDKCLRRVELGSMKYIRQNCEASPSQEVKIQNIQSKLSKLGVVLATSHFFEDGNFVSSILINRSGIAVSGGGLRINYWENFPSHRKDDIECEAIIHLSKEQWYAEILSSEAPCL